MTSGREWDLARFLNVSSSSAMKRPASASNATSHCGSCAAAEVRVDDRAPDRQRAAGLTATWCRRVVMIFRIDQICPTHTASCTGVVRRHRHALDLVMNVDAVADEIRRRAAGRRAERAQLLQSPYDTSARCVASSGTSVILRNLAANTTAAASGSPQMLNSAEGVTLPISCPPPMMTISGTRSTSLG